MVSHTITVAIVGDAGVGKTSYIERLSSGNFIDKYNKTSECEVKSIKFNSTGQNSTNGNDNVCFNIWDCPGDGVVIMFDLQNEKSYADVDMWYNKVSNICGDIPITLCGNKCDLLLRNIQPNEINYHRKKNIKYFDLSAKSNYNFDKPILEIARKLIDPDLLFL